MPTAEMRRDVLPEAFLTPADGRNIDASAEDCESETEELSTTPLQLLQVCCFVGLMQTLQLCTTPYC